MADRQLQDGEFLNDWRAPFKFCLFKVKPESREQEVQNLWGHVLSILFPVSETYMMRFKATVMADSSAVPDAIVIEIREIRDYNPEDYSAVEKQIFMLLGKRPSKDTDDEWALTGAPAQLQLNMERTTNEPGNRMFGAVAIGTKVVFYEWDKTSTTPLRPLHEDKIDLVWPTSRPKCEYYMKYVKEHGWSWACS